MFLPTAETSEKYLVRLHSQLIRSLQAYHRTQAQWERIVARALDLEDEVANLENADRNFLRSACKIRDSGTDLGWTYIRDQNFGGVSQPPSYVFTAGRGIFGVQKFLRYRRNFWISISGSKFQT